MLKIYEAAAESVPPETILVDCHTLARIISVSLRWVVENRRRIIGAQKVGGRWRFNLEIIRNRILSGKDIIKPGYKK